MTMQGDKEVFLYLRRGLWLCEKMSEMHRGASESFRARVSVVDVFDDLERSKLPSWLEGVPTLVDAADQKGRALYRGIDAMLFWQSLILQHDHDEEEAETSEDADDKEATSADSDEDRDGGIRRKNRSKLPDPENLMKERELQAEDIRVRLAAGKTTKPSSSSYRG